MEEIREESLKEIVMRRDGLSEKEADEQIAEAREMILEFGEDLEEVLASEFGLEPDFIFDLFDRDVRSWAEIRISGELFRSVSV